MKRAKKKDESGEWQEMKQIEIVSGTIKDDEKCNYAFEVKSGVGLGFIHDVKGKGIVMEDMKKAFARLNVHMAVIDDAFGHSKIDMDNIDNFHNHELVALYNVSGFIMCQALQ